MERAKQKYRKNCPGNELTLQMQIWASKLLILSIFCWWARYASLHPNSLVTFDRLRGFNNEDSPTLIPLRRSLGIKTWAPGSVCYTTLRSSDMNSLSGK